MAGQKNCIAKKEVFARWIERTMKKEKLKPSTVAQWVGCSKSTFSKMQNRKETRIFTFEEAYLFSKNAGIPLEEIASSIFEHPEAWEVSETQSKKNREQTQGKNDIYLERFKNMSFEDQEFIMDLYDRIKKHSEKKE